MEGNETNIQNSWSLFGYWALTHSKLPQALLSRAQMANDQLSLDHVAREILIRSGLGGSKAHGGLRSAYVFHLTEVIKETLKLYHLFISVCEWLIMEGCWKGVKFQEEQF